MEGLFYYHDMQGVTWLWFYPDGRVISYSKSNFKQSFFASTRFTEGLEEIYFFRGTYKVDIWEHIRIIVRGQYGKVVYKGFIRDENTLDLFCRCPFTNYKKSETYLRHKEDEHIINMEFSSISIN